MSKAFVPIQTADIEWRENLPFSQQFQDVYFSTTGGLEQSRYVFIDGNQLISRWKKHDGLFTIAETGFGTGLNFLHTWKLWLDHAPKNASLHYIACEKHPLKPSDLRKALELWPELATQYGELINQYPVLTPGFHYLSFANGRIKLSLMLGDVYECFEQLLICGESNLERSLRQTYIEAWFLDGFAPAKNESMWNLQLFHIIAMLSKPGTTYATYTASGFVKQNLMLVGFSVDKKKGFGPKRHMLSGELINTETMRIKNRSTPWQETNPQKVQDKSAVVIGGGLAGCFISYSLAIRGWKVTLFEEQDELGLGASANQKAVLFPKLSAFQSPFTQFMLHSFLYATSFYRNFFNISGVGRASAQQMLGEFKGCLMLAHNKTEQQAQQSLVQWLNSYPELGELVDAARGSELSGITIDKSGLFISLSGWLNSKALCDELVSRENIEVITGKVEAIKEQNGKWRIGGMDAEVVILANGFNANQFPQTEYLPIKPIRGQMTQLQATIDSTKLQIPLCGEGHVLPPDNGNHWLGATYEIGNHIAAKTYADDQTNLSKLANLTASDIWSNKIVANWSGIRATTPDYLPLIGQIAKDQEFLNTFKHLDTNAKRWIATAGPYYPGLYVFAGFGSRGLTTIPLSAEWLAAKLNNEMGPLPRQLIQAISPARFLRKKIVRGQIYDYEKAREFNR